MKKKLAVLAVLVLIINFSCSDDSENIDLREDNEVEKPIDTVSTVEKTLVLNNAFPNLSFSRPLDLQSPPDTTNRIFVAEQAGIIKVFEGDATATIANKFLDISGRIASQGELGLLGFVFHPDYERTGFVYVAYTPTNSLFLVSRFKVLSTDENKLDEASETILLSIEQPATNHNGGQLAFGPDNYLYIATGDGGGAGDPNGNAQNLNNLLGNILRIDVDNQDEGLNYAIPTDNPFINSPNARPEIYAYGLRNPWRFSFDTQTEKIWSGDVGQGRLEEINIIEKGGNYGWNILEGTTCFGADTCDDSNTIGPVFEYNHQNNDRSITGGYVYRGTQIESLQGFFIYGDFVSGRIWALEANNPEVINNRLLFETGLNIASFGEGQDNELYVCSFDGAIYKFEEQ